MTAGPFIPKAQEAMRFSMAGDDCSLHFDLDKLTQKQAEDHYANQVLTGMLQVALLYIAKTNDEVCLYDLFRTEPWSEWLRRYHAMFARAGLEPVGLDRVTYHPVDDYYESVASDTAATPFDTLYMISGSNQPIHQSDALLRMSQNLNSKVHFAEYAPAFGLPTPDTLIASKDELRGERVEAFLARHSAPVMLKILGLAGARNVTTIHDVAEAEAYLSEYDGAFPLILQERLDLAAYEEMTVDLCVSQDLIEITNVRRILFADGLWVGNELGRNVRLSDEHEQALLQVGEYARSHGYNSEIGFNLGIDYFQRRPGADSTLPELIVTEINARWTGGLFPAELVERLQVQDQEVVAFIDMCPPDRLDNYVSFMESHLTMTDAETDSGAPFSICPMGFAPFDMEMDGREFCFVWQIVCGDFVAFADAVTADLGADTLPTANQIAAIQKQERGVA